jgi:hypothetical protein
MNIIHNTVLKIPHFTQCVQCQLVNNFRLICSKVEKSNNVKWLCNFSWYGYVISAAVDKTASIFVDYYRRCKV